VQPLADLIPEVLKGERLYTVQGNDWYGWWAGRLANGRQVLALPFFGASIPKFVGLLTGRGPLSPALALISGRSQVFAAFGGRSVYYFRWHQMTHPELADPDAGSATLYLDIFDGEGRLLDVHARPDPLRIAPVEVMPDSC